ncbi:MAG: GGDEF domain-containing protein [bacterium]
MTPLPSGLVLPSDILTQPWFGIFGLFVAFNTIIYLGLTAAKLTPWPQQIHPARVRQIIPDSLEDAQMQKSYRAAFRELDDPVRALREESARQTIPLALALVGSLSVTVGLVYIALYYGDEGPVLIFGPVFGLLLIALSMLLARSGASDRTMIWTWTLLMVGFVAETSWRATELDSAVVLSYALVGIVVTAPIALSWPAAITGSALGLPIVVVAGYVVSVVDTLSWIVAAATAVLAGFVLLYLRLATVDRLALEQANSNLLRSTDPMTGAFSRTGLMALAGTIAESAERSHEDVSVILCDLVGMRSINDGYGLEYGDDVLRATVRALRVALPEGTLVARWGGDGFLGLVQGPVPDASELIEAVNGALADTGVALGKRPVTVHLSVVTGSPEGTTLEELVTRAAQGIDDTTHPTA